MALSRSQMAALLTQAEARLRVMFLRIDQREWKSVYDEVGKAIAALELAGSYIQANLPNVPQPIPPAEPDAGGSVEA